MAFGAENAVNLVLDLLIGQGGSNITAKPSRVDLCLDLLAPADFWTGNLLQTSVTRAQAAGLYFHNKKITGISIGKGNLSARLYDKPLEIRQKSKKYWMYDIWGLNEVPEGRKIIRTEFQLRREALVELAINSTNDLFSTHRNIWKYCTEKWLKFRTNPGKHHTQRKTYFWREIIQEVTKGQRAKPSRPVQINKPAKRTVYESGSWCIMFIVRNEQYDENGILNISNFFGDTISSLIHHQKDLERKGKSFPAIIQNKIAKNRRLKTKNSDAILERKKQGFPTGIKFKKGGEKWNRKRNDD